MDYRIPMHRLSIQLLLADGTRKEADIFLPSGVAPAVRPNMVYPEAVLPSKAMGLPQASLTDSTTSFIPVKKRAAKSSAKSSSLPYFGALMTPQLSAECARDMGEGGGPLWREALRQMGRDGWIGLGWPEALGVSDLGHQGDPIARNEVIWKDGRALLPRPRGRSETRRPGRSAARARSLTELHAPSNFVPASRPGKPTGSDPIALRVKRGPNRWLGANSRLRRPPARYHEESALKESRTET